MRESSAQIANERRKSLAQVAFNLATALIAATVAQAYSASSFDPSLVLWSFGAGALIWIGWVILSLLEPEA